MLGLSSREFSDEVSIHVAFVIDDPDILERVTPKTVRFKARCPGAGDP